MIVRAALAALGSAALLLPAPAAAQDPAPSAPIVAAPAHPRGTVVLVHSGAWSGPSPRNQQLIAGHVGAALVAAGYRSVSIDYERGASAGRASVHRAIRRERARSSHGPLCVYGESAGGHLGLLAAEASDDVDCIATYGAPTDFHALRAAAAAHPERPGFAYTQDQLVEPVFGTAPSDWRPWEPARSAARLRADLLLMMSRDDPIVPRNQLTGMHARVPTARTYLPPAGDLDDQSDAYMHGTAAPAGRRAIARHVVGLVDRAVAVRHATAVARRTHCADVGRPASGRRLRTAVACVVSHRLRPGLRPADGSRGRRVAVRILGPVTPATVAAAAARSRAARAALERGDARRLAVRVRLGAPSRVRLNVG